MLGLAKRTKARILLTSTSEVYGDPIVHPQTEEYWGNVNPIGPRSCYDEGKRCAETLFFDYRRQHDLDIKVVRLFNTYGPRMQPDDGRVVSNFIMQALGGQPLTVYGTGEQTRSFCYVDDTVEALVRMMATDHEVTGPINIGNPHEITVGELAERITGRGRPDRRACSTCPCPPTIPSSASPTSPGQGDPRLEAGGPLEEGLARTVAWFSGLRARESGRRRCPRTVAWFAQTYGQAAAEQTLAAFTPELNLTRRGASA